MAAIDFPASPSIGQAFTAGNGVTYTWNGLLWVASGASAGGDVYAKNSTGFGIGTTETVVSFNTIVTGNSGGWYNTSNGRFTPPAGRYFIRVQMTGSPEHHHDDLFDHPQERCCDCIGSRYDRRLPRIRWNRR